MLCDRHGDRAHVYAQPRKIHTRHVVTRAVGTPASEDTKATIRLAEMAQCDPTATGTQTRS